MSGIRVDFPVGAERYGFSTARTETMTTRRASSTAPRVCLVSMPFHPIQTPALGVSLLKAVLERDGCEVDVEYGSLRFLDFFGPLLGTDDTALVYQVLATAGLDPGELFLSDALWGDDRRLFARAARAVLGAPPAREHLGDRAAERLAAQADVFDEHAEGFLEVVYRARDWDGYDVVGFSSTFAQNVACLALARRIHTRNPGVHIVFGGANCDGTMGLELIRSFPQVHSVVRGEGEATLPLLVRAVARGEEELPDLPGLLTRCGGDVRVGPPPRLNDDLDGLPLPSFEDYFAQISPEFRRHLEARAGLRLPVETARGCWWGEVQHCVFCGLNRDGMRFRSKSPARAVAEFRSLRDAYGVARFDVVDNIIDRSYFREVLPTLEADGLQFFYETKANLTEAEVERLGRSGVRMIQPGIEGLSTSLLRLMGKGVPAYRNLELLKWCATYDVEPLWFYLFGFAHERDEDHLASAEIMPLVAHLPPPRGTNNVKLDRGSPYFERWREYGFRNLHPAGFGDLAYRGLAPAARERLAYHFLADLPQGAAFSYLPALVGAAEQWKERHGAGAFLEQYRGRHVTVVLDGRADEPRAFLLEGLAHRTHELLRRARPWRELAEGAALTSSGSALPTPGDDAELRSWAARMDATVVGDGRPDVRASLGALEECGLVLPIDGRHLALAVDPRERRGVESMERQLTGVTEVAQGGW